MKTKQIRITLALLALFSSLTQAAPLGTAFTYQGRLTDGTNAACGIYDFRFAICDVASGGTPLVMVTNSAVGVTNGLFTTTLDFGSGVFIGDARWLGISVRTNGSGAFNPLSPRQAVKPSPYAIQAAGAASADSVAAANITGTLALAQLPDAVVTNAETGVVLGGIFVGNGVGLGNLNADNLASGTVSDARLSANVALLDSSPTFTGTVTSGGDLIADRLQIGGGHRLTGSYSTIAGVCNTNLSDYSAIGGGYENTIQSDAGESFIGGGNGNILEFNTDESFIGAGVKNIVHSNAYMSFIGGGYSNTIGTDAAYATVPGGSYNTAGSDYSFAAGRRAKAANKGAFVWADSQNADFSSTGNNQFLIRAAGGVGINTNDPSGAALNIAGTARADAFQGDGSDLTGLNASHLSSGVVPLAQLPGAVVTNTETGVTLGGTFNGNATTANNFSGSLSGDVTGTQSATVVSAVGGQTAADVASGAAAANAATAADTAGAIVKRNLFGNFAANTVTLDGNLKLAETTATDGIIYSGTNTVLHTYGYRNFFAGQDAGNLTLDGTDNTGVGSSALRMNTSGSDNTANGAGALYHNTSGSYNTANGTEALLHNTTAFYNTAIGYEALSFNGNGGGNTAIGYQALCYNTNGIENTANGYRALISNISGDCNTANGAEALYENTSGYDNTANGYQALSSNTNGYENTANGVEALYENTSGSCNTASGAGALHQNITGSYNTADGNETLLNNTTGSYNTASGYQALWDNMNGEGNTAIGYDALYANTNGTENAADGYRALYSNTRGSANTACGPEALYNNTSGSNNIALGYEAGDNLTTGSYNIDIGNEGVTNESKTIRIGEQGTQTSTFIAGIYDATASGGVAVYVNSSGKLGISTSSRRFKENIRAMADSSDVLYALHPVTFRYKPGVDPHGVPQFGLVAEDVDQVDPDLVVRDDQHGIYTVRYEAVNAMLLNEFLKQHRKVEEQASEIASLKEKTAEIQALKQSVAELKETLTHLTQQSN